MNTFTEADFSRISRVHQASILVGQIYADYYQELKEGSNQITQEEVDNLLKMHQELRRMLPKDAATGKRIGSADAYNSTRG